MRRRALVVVAVLVAAGCSSGGEAEPPEAVVRVFASSSLIDVFQDLGARFTSVHPEVRIEFTFSTAVALLEEVERGRAAAVLATADTATMRAAVERGHARGPRVFARNHLTLVVGQGNPKGIAGFSDLDRPDVRFGLCVPEVPCGSLALDALERAGVDREPETTRHTARAVLGEVESGAIDAAVVFVTTPEAGDAVEPVVSLDGADPDLEAVYEITVLAGAVARDEAEVWIEFVLGADGQSILAEAGFEPVA